MLQENGGEIDKCLFCFALVHVFLKTNLVSLALTYLLKIKILGFKIACSSCLGSGLTIYPGSLNP